MDRVERLISVKFGSRINNFINLQENTKNAHKNQTASTIRYRKTHRLCNADSYGVSHS